MLRKLLLFVVAVTICISASAQDTPHIVKRLHLYNQTGAIGPITLYTPKVGRGGMFRVNTFLVVTAGNNMQGFYCGAVGFTDKVGPSQVYATTDNCAPTNNTGNAAAGTQPVPDKGGHPLSFSVIANENTQGAKYDVTIIVEEL